jgi:hypothetical protein
MIIQCHVCQRDPAGRQGQPVMLFTDPTPDDDHRHACRDHLSEKREAEIRTREKELGWPPGGLR